jgi:pimeloyl-ACP methyl ester carboxylesterase
MVDWAKVGGALAVAGRAVGRTVGRAAVRAGEAVADGYRAIDPDVRRHAFELPLLGLTMFGSRSNAIERLPEDGRRAVVFVHGLGGHPGNFFPMRTYLRSRGHRRCYAVGLHEETPVAEQAAALARFVDEIIRVNELAAERSVDVVAHSMGGLVARAALAAHRPLGRSVANLITLGTPHAGSHAARYGYTRAMLDLRPGSPLLSDLDRQLPWRGPPDQPELVAMWSRADVLLLPAESAVVEGASSVELEGLTHYGYLLHPTAWRVTAELLAR